MPRLGAGFPLVARGSELDRLRSAIERATSGQAGAVLVSGDAGVGKSRLLAETAESAQRADVPVLVGRCVDIGEAGFPYLPFTEIAEQLRSAAPEIFARWPALATLTGAEPPIPAGQDSRSPHEFDQLKLFDGVLGALTELSSDRCVIVQIEDLHWSDPSTRDLLSFLLSRLGDQRLLIIGSYRSDDLHRQHPLRALLAELVRLPSVERLEVQPFGPADAEAFVRVLAGDDDIADDVVAHVAARSEGNAFFAEELVAASAAPGDGIPTVLADVLLNRVEKLSSFTRRVLRAASVTGRHQVRHATLAAVLDLAPAELECALREAIQHHVLVPGIEDAYAFRHALLREAIYADLLPGERIRLHAAYAARIAEHKTNAAALAYHATCANDLPTALKASVTAAHEARRKGAPRSELNHLERALELWSVVDDPGSRTGVSEHLLTSRAAHAAISAGRSDRALAHIRAAVPLADAAGDPVLAADTRRQLAEILVDNSRWDDARATIEAAWEVIAETSPSAERSWVLAIRARVALGHPDLRTMAEAAVAAARESGTTDAEADALITLAYWEHRDGDAEATAALLEQAGQRAADAGSFDVELRVRFNLVFEQLDRGRLDAAATIVDAAVARAAGVGLTWSPYGRDLHWLRSITHYARGDWETAAKAAAPPGEPLADVVSALHAATRAMILVDRGAFGEAERILTRLLPEGKRLGNEQISHLAGAASVELARWQGRSDEAVTLAETTIDLVRAFSGEKWPLAAIRFYALALSALGDARRPGLADPEALDRAERLLREAHETAEHGIPRGATMGPEGRAWLLRADAEAGRATGAADPAQWRSVVDGFAYGDVYQQAYAQWRWAEALVSAGTRSEATELLRAALNTAERLGALPLADGIRALARRARISLPGAPTATTDLLTPRERAVLRQVARGRTNRVVGERLFISEKTVSVHLSRAMAKLGASGRTEAVALALQRGLIDDDET